MPLQIAEISALAFEARTRISGVIRETPLRPPSTLFGETDANVWLKQENEQHTGSFKLRGAANCLMSLTPEQRDAGVVTASSGNHGAALAYAMRELGCRGVIFVPEQTTPAKIDAIRAYGGDVRLFGTDGLDTELHARDFAAENRMYYVSPYNDIAVIAGQGSCGVEIIEQLPNVEAAFIAVGGGGLMSGVGSVLRQHNPDIRLYGCQPAASAVMARSVAAGKVLDLPSEGTLSDGTAGGVEVDSITFDLCASLVDEFVLVSEAQIAEAMRVYMASEDGRIEGAAGVAIAALEARQSAVAGKNVVVIICGGNVSASTIDALRDI